MTDRYDNAIKYLTNDPDAIQQAWNNPSNSPGGCLFDYVSPDNNDTHRPTDGRACGCLTQIRSGTAYGTVAWWPSITNEIRRDTRIPDQSDITIEDLPVFAEWQRAIDLLREEVEA
jgi:hypothetical protein